MTEEIASIQIAHNQSVRIEPHGFWHGKFPVVVAMFDEPARRRLEITAGGRRYTVELPVPALERA